MMRLLLFCTALCLITACQPDASLQVLPAQNAIIGLNSPIDVDGSASVSILTQDYFIDPQAIDSIVSRDYSVTLNADKTELQITPTNPDAIPHFASFQVFVAGYPYAFLVQKSKKQPVTFSYPNDPSVKQVSLVGDMTNWQPLPMKKGPNGWASEEYLLPGDYQYKFAVDEPWLLDPNNPDKVGNGFGGFNSLISVYLSDNPAALPQLSTLDHTANVVRIKATNCAQRPLVFLDNFLLGDESLSFNKDILSISLPGDLQKQKRSFLRIYAANEVGPANDLLIPLHFGQVMQDPEQLDRMDKEAMVMYFPLVDRFNNGDPSNDDPVGDERLLPLTDYMGGDLKGITKKIQDGYFKQLGINTIWLSPITQNPLSAFQEYIEPQRFFSGYHGYWPILSSKVDHRFGTEADLKELVDVAHENGMNVLLDYICNHVHEQHPMIQNNPDWATEFMLPDGRRNLRLWDEQRLTTWFDTFLPSLDLADSEVIDVQSDSALYWVKEFGLDGYRQDASKHVPLEFWRTLTRKLKDKVIIPQNRPIYQIGETYATNELIKTYISSGLLDAQFDFNLSGAAGRAIIQDENSLERVAAAMRSTKEIFGSHHSMGNLTGNHDQPRFMAYAGGDLQYDEDSREAGFNRKIVVKDEHGYQKLQTMTAFLMTIPGIPVIYYGDEIGMVGANDPDNRRMMRFDGLNNKEQETLNNARALAQLRKNNLVFTYGDLELLASSKDQLVYARNYFGRTAIIAISKGKNQTIEVDVPERFNLNNLKAFKEKSFSLQDRTLSLEVGKDDFQILYH